MKENTSPLMVTIRCLAYNHEPYIRQCLEGFVMQKTNFRFEAIVHDDASTDGTAAIIREYAEKYPDIIKPIFETENQYSKRDGSLRRIMNAHMHGKYIAMCEGDDYWIDPLKLQKQVDFLEEHPDYVFCHTSFKLYYENDNIYVLSRDILTNIGEERCNDRKYILNGYRILTLTVLLRKETYYKAIYKDNFLFSGYFKMGDTNLWYELAAFGRYHFMPEITAIYRKNEGSFSRAKDAKSYYQFALSSIELRLYLSQRDKLGADFINYYQQKFKIALLNYRCFDPSYSSQIYNSDLELPFIMRFFINTGILKKYLIFKFKLTKKLGSIYRRCIKPKYNF